VASKQRESRIAELRAAAQSQNLQDRLKSLEEEIALFEEDNQQLGQMLKLLEGECERMQEENNALESKVSVLTYEKEHFQQQSAQSEVNTRALQARLQALNRLDQLPETLSGVVDCIERLHAGRIVFTDRAKESARKSSFDDAAKTWKCLWAMATVLHD